MAIRMITGRQERRMPDRSHRIYDEIKKAMDTGAQKLILIVPEQYTLGAERALMDHCALMGLMDVDVLSLGRLATRIFEETGGAARTIVDDHGRQMLLARCLQSVHGDLSVYGRSAGKPGFLGNMTDFISEMKQNLVDCDTLEATIGAMNDERLITQKLKDMLTIYREYETLLGDRRWDSDNRDIVLCDKIGQSEMLAGAKVWIDGFYTFTPSDFAIIEAIAGRVDELVMSLVGDMDELTMDAPIFEVCRATCHHMAQIAEATGHNFRVETIHETRTQVSALDHLEKELYAYHATPFKGTPDCITIRQCMDIWEEGQAAARTITTLVRERGYRYGDIAILVGDPGTAGGTIARALAGYGIPSFTDRVVEIQNNNLVEALLSALEAVVEPYPMDALMSFAKSGFAPIDAPQGRMLENYAIAMGIRGRAWENTFTMNDEETWDLEVLNISRENLITPLQALKQAQKGELSYNERLRAVVVFLESIEALTTLTKLTDFLEEKGDFEALGHYNQIWNILMEVLDQVDSAMGESTCTLVEFIAVLKGGLSTYAIGILPERQDVVAITDPFRSRGEHIKALLILGANEGVLPLGSNRFTLLSETERRQLKQFGVALQDNPEYRRSREDYSIYIQVAKTEEYLYCSYSMNNEDGEALSVSPLIGNLRTVYPTVPVISALDDGDPLEWVAGAKGTMDALALHLAVDDAPAVSQAVFNWYQGQKDYVKPLNQLNHALHYKGIAADMPKGILGELYGRPIQASISRLEQYRACPFAHFVHYGISPRLREEYAVSQPDIGTLLHSVIDTVFRRAKAEGLSVSALDDTRRDEWVQQAMNDLLPATGNKVFTSTGSYRFLGRKLKRVGRQTLRVLAQHLDAGGFEYKYSEQFFNRHMVVPGLPDGVNVRGIVDRIDTYVKDGETFIKVIDYKTGAKKIDLAEVYYGISLQLLVYMDMGMDLVEKEAENQTDCLPGGTFYFHVDDPMIREDGPIDDTLLQGKIDKAFKMNGLFLDDARVRAALDTDGRTSDVFEAGSKKSCFTQEEFSDLMDFVEQVIRKSVREISEGNISISPYRMGERRACDFCDYASICQMDDQLNRTAYRVFQTRISKDALLEKARGGQVDDTMDN